MCGGTQPDVADSGQHWCLLVADVRKKTVTIVDSLSSCTYTTCAEQSAYKWMLVFETVDYIQLRNCTLLRFIDPHLLFVNSWCLIYTLCVLINFFMKEQLLHIMSTATIHMHNYENCLL